MHVLPHMFQILSLPVSKIRLEVSVSFVKLKTCKAISVVFGIEKSCKCRYVVTFLKEHGKEVYIEVRGAYIDTMNKVGHFCTSVTCFN